MNKNSDLADYSQYEEQRLQAILAESRIPVGNPTRSLDHTCMDLAVKLYLGTCVEDDQIRGILGKILSALVYGAEHQTYVDRLAFDLAAAIARKHAPSLDLAALL